MDKSRTGVTRRETLKTLAALSGSAFLFWSPRYKTAVSRPTFARTGDVEFSWSGAATSSSVRVVAQLSRPSEQVRLVASLESDLRDPVFSEPVFDHLTVNSPLVLLSLAQLVPNRRYYYALEVDGVIDTSQIGRFRTLPHNFGSFKFACSSCAATGSNHPVFETIRQKDPHFFLHMGDMHYENIMEDDPALFQIAYKKVWHALNQYRLYRDVPIVYTWDDHDYGGNSSDKTAVSRTAARQAYQACVPHYPLVHGAGNVPIYQAFTVGRVRFLLTDARSKRVPLSLVDNDDKTLLGWEQKRWLKNEMLEAQERYALTVWVNTVPWIDDGRQDGWGQYRTERQELANFVQSNQIDRLLMVSGDAHMIAIDDGTNNRFADSPAEKGFPIFHAAALDSSPSHKGGPYSHGHYTGRGQFGMVEVTDHGDSAIQVKLTGLNHENVPQAQYTYTVDVPSQPKLFLPISKKI